MNYGQSDISSNRNGIRSITFRVDKEILEKLKEESLEKGINFNSLLTGF
ncbi:MAG: BrnA antitoxin family protein [Thermoproteota archaeon]|nr:BrnA antitoxin family protein [Thermoproteota archaeon]